MTVMAHRQTRIWRRAYLSLERINNERSAKVNPYLAAPALALGLGMAAPAINPTDTANAQREYVVKEQPVGWEHYAGMVEKAAGRHGIDLDLAWKIFLLENEAGDPSRPSNKGAIGLGQIMPKTWNQESGHLPEEIVDAEKNINFAMEYFGKQLNRFHGDVALALMAYNWGPTATDKWVKGGRSGGVPLETRLYVERILGIPFDSVLAPELVQNG